MKLIKCIISKTKVEALKQTLLAEGVQGMTLYEVKGFGMHRAQLSQKVSRNYLVEFKPQTMLELVMEDDKVEKTIKLITSTAKSGRLSDGKIFILPVEDAVRIRTSERGKAAL